MVAFGTSGGLSFFALTLLLSYRMSCAGIDTRSVGAFALAAVPYNIRFLWPYLIDSVKIPYLSDKVGQRKSWGYLTHGIGVLCFFSLGWIDPSSNLSLIFVLVLVSAFLAAMQDIVSDAYRFSMVDVLPTTESVPLHTIGFRCGKLVAASFIPTLASYVGWMYAHSCALFIKLIALSLLFFLPEPKYVNANSKEGATLGSMHDALIAIMDALKKVLKKHGVWIFLSVFILIKAIDVVMGPLETYFLGQIGVSSKQYGVMKGGIGGAVSFIGVWTAGYLSRKLSINSALKIGCLCLSASGLLSLLFMRVPIDASLFEYVLTSVAVVQEFNLGLVITLSVVYVSLFCNKSDSIYDFTLFSSIGSMGRTVLTFFLSDVCFFIGWVPIFFLPLLLYVPLFLLLGRDFSSKLRLEAKR